MENPTFRLEGVVHTKGSMEDFEGPLTLILQLLSRNRIEIRDIRISDILDQYLAYLDEMKRLDLEIASEFVTMASYLVYLKARTLLETGEEEVSELETLISSLEALKNRESFARLKEGTAFLAERAGTGAALFTRPPEPLRPVREYGYRHERGELLTALLALIGREHEEGGLPRSFTMPARVVYPIGEKTEEILLLLREKGSVPVETIFARCHSRSELVASFMAVLELAKNGGLLLCEDEQGGFTAEYRAPATQAESGGEEDGAGDNP